MKIEVIRRENGKAYLKVDCPVSKTGECKWSLWQEPAKGIMWQWDGNVEAPTISPSINCLHGCGRHFTITKGVAHP